MRVRHIFGESNSCEDALENISCGGSFSLKHCPAQMEAYLLVD